MKAAELSRDSSYQQLLGRIIYLAYQKGATPSHLLSWSHYIELLKLDDPQTQATFDMYWHDLQISQHSADQINCTILQGGNP